MPKENIMRASLVDGSTEKIPSVQHPLLAQFEPIFEEIIVPVMTFDGLEMQAQKRLIGYKKRKK